MSSCIRWLESTGKGDSAALSEDMWARGEVSGPGTLQIVARSRGGLP